MTDLSFATSDELLAEITRRYAAFVFTGIPSVNEKGITYQFRIGGHFITCLGLAKVLTRRLNALENHIELRNTPTNTEAEEPEDTGAGDDT